MRNTVTEIYCTNGGSPEKHKVHQAGGPSQYNQSINQSINQSSLLY